MLVLHGWSGMALACTAVQVPLIAGLVRARGRLRHYVLSPLAAVPLAAVVGVGVGVRAFVFAHLV